MASGNVIKINNDGISGRINVGGQEVPFVDIYLQLKNVNEGNPVTFVQVSITDPNTGNQVPVAANLELT